MASPLGFSDDFPPPALDAWRALVEKGLKGAEFERRLVHRTEDGLHIPPLFTAADELPEPAPPGCRPFIRGGRAGGTGWDIRPLCRLSDPLAANRAILADLQGGASSILLDAGAFGPRELAAALDGVMLDLAPVYLRQLRYDVPAGAVQLHDPLADWSTGIMATPEVDRFRPAPGSLLAVNGTLFDDAGASDAQEIGLTVAALLDFARQLEDQGIGPDEAFRSFVLQSTTNVDFFAGIAKLRALRRLWGRITEVAGVEAPPVLHVVTSARMLTRYDAWTNLLRNTIAAAAAGLGGADALTVLPHDHVMGLPDAFAARMARNIQNVLLEEARLGQVTDPTGGSWYVEQLTEQLAQAGWLVLQKVEAADGFRAACMSGLVEEMLAAQHDARAERIATRSRPVVGISVFADAGETVPPPRSTPVRLRLAASRDAEPFEDIRDRVLQGGAASVLVLTVGPPNRHMARLDFATSLFASVGMRCVVASEVNAYPQAGARLAVLCGHDDDLALHALDLVRGLRQVGAREVHVLGRPPAMEKAWREAGVTGFLFQGQDMVRYLADVVERST